jgi:hypothetical protein
VEKGSIISMPHNRRSKSFLQRHFSPSILLLPIFVSLLMWATPAAAGRLIMSDAELSRRPMSGSGWNLLKSVADGPLGAPNFSDQDNRHAAKTLAVGRDLDLR